MFVLVDPRTEETASPRPKTSNPSSAVQTRATFIATSWSCSRRNARRRVDARPRWCELAHLARLPGDERVPAAGRTRPRLPRGARAGGPPAAARASRAASGELVRERWALARQRRRGWGGLWRLRVHGGSVGSARRARTAELD